MYVVVDECVFDCNVFELLGIGEDRFVDDVESRLVVVVDSDGLFG